MKGYGMYVIVWLYKYNDTVSVLCISMYTVGIGSVSEMVMLL